MRATPSSPRSVTISVASNSPASFCRGARRLIAMMRAAPIRDAESTPSRPTASTAWRIAVVPFGWFLQGPSGAFSGDEPQRRGTRFRADHRVDVGAGVAGAFGAVGLVNRVVVVVGDTDDPDRRVRAQ